MARRTRLTRRTYEGGYDSDVRARKVGDTDLRRRRLVMSGSGGEAAAVPDSLVAGYWFNYDFSDTASITDAGAGAVSAVDNEEGTAARDLAQSTAGSRPITGTRTIGGLNAIDFDGVDDFLETGNLTQAQPFTVYAVFALDVLDGGDHNVFTLGSGPFFGSSVGPPDKFYANSGLAYVEIANADTSPHLFTGVFDGATSDFYIDGVLAVSDADPGGLGLSGEPLQIGAYAGGVLAFDGTVGQVVAYTLAQSAGDIGDNNTFLMDKWSI